MLKKYFIVLVCCFFTGFGGSLAMAQAQVLCPEVTFKYDWRSYIMDMVGSFYYKAPVTDEIRNQLDIQLPHFIAAWKKGCADNLWRGLFGFQARISI